MQPRNESQVVRPRQNDTLAQFCSPRDESVGYLATPVENLAIGNRRSPSTIVTLHMFDRVRPATAPTWSGSNKGGQVNSLHPVFRNPDRNSGTTAPGYRSGKSIRAQSVRHGRDDGHVVQRVVTACSLGRNSATSLEAPPSSQRGRGGPVSSYARRWERIGDLEGAQTDTIGSVGVRLRTQFRGQFISVHVAGIAVVVFD